MKKWFKENYIVIGLWLGLNNTFYLFNFSYIGTCIAVGIYLL